MIYYIIFLLKKEITALLEEKTLEIAPLGYMRGRTFKNAWIIADGTVRKLIILLK